VDILAYTIFNDLPGRHNWFMLRNAARPDHVLTEDLILHYIELYKPEPAAKPSRLAAWIEVLKAEREGEDMNVLLGDDRIFRKAHEAFQWCTHDRESREIALSRERFLRDQASNLEFALEQGMEKGIAKGIEQGIEQGINTGREEAKLENAKAMKLKGFDTTLIMEITGLKRESVDKL
jgi:predicted transposase/invertase (TIGR01784 family)